MKKNILQFLSGLLVTLSLGVIGYYTVIKKSGEGISLLTAIKVQFRTVEGLKYGNPVFVKGLPLGEVQDIEIKNNEIAVKILLQEKVQFYRDYSIVLKNFSVFGKKAIYINPGREKFGPVPDEVALHGKAIENPFDMAAYVLSENREQFTQILTNVAQITGKINDSGGSLSLFINDPVIYNKTVKSLRDAQKVIAHFKKMYYRYRTEVASKTLESAVYQLDE